MEQKKKGKRTKQKNVKRSSYLEQRQPRAHPGAAPVRRGDDAQLGRHRGVPVRAGPELGEGDLECLVLLDAVVEFWFWSFSFFLRGLRLRERTK